MVCLDSLGVFKRPTVGAKHHPVTGSSHRDKIGDPMPEQMGQGHIHYLPVRCAASSGLEWEVGAWAVLLPNVS